MIVGGWSFVVAAYGFSYAGLIAYGASIWWRLSQARRDAATELSP